MHYVKNLLYINRKDPRKFWRNIKSVIENANIDFEDITFKHPDSGIDISKDQASNFINEH